MHSTTKTSLVCEENASLFVRKTKTHNNFIVKIYPVVLYTIKFFWRQKQIWREDKQLDSLNILRRQVAFSLSYTKELKCALMVRRHVSYLSQTIVQVVCIVDYAQCSVVTFLCRHATPCNSLSHRLSINMVFTVYLVPEESFMGNIAQFNFESTVYETQYDEICSNTHMNYRYFSRSVCTNKFRPKVLSVFLFKKYQIKRSIVLI